MRSLPRETTAYCYFQEVKKLPWTSSLSQPFTACESSWYPSLRWRWLENTSLVLIMIFVGMFSSLWEKTFCPWIPGPSLYSIISHWESLNREDSTGAASSLRKALGAGKFPKWYGFFFSVVDNMWFLLYVEVQCMLRCLECFVGDNRLDSVTIRLAGESKLLFEQVRISSYLGFLGSVSCNTPVTLNTSPGGVLSFSNCSYWVSSCSSSQLWLTLATWIISVLFCGGLNSLASFRWLLTFFTYF